MKQFQIMVSLFALSFLSFSAQAADCEATIDSTDRMRYDTDRIAVDASCESFTLTLTHSGEMAKNVMGHNWVLTLTDDFQAVGQDGVSAGLENDYIKPGDERVIAYTEVIGGGEQTSVTFDASELNPEADYTFFCSFPGHSSLMKGDLVVES